jgi:hypothetical protein
MAILPRLRRRPLETVRRPRRSPRPALALASALLAPALAGVCLAGCGGIPAGAVAQVDGHPIATATFEHWLRIAASGSAGASGGRVVLPRPPRYSACVADLAASEPRPAKHEKPPSRAQLRSQCAQRYRSLRNAALGYLISADWLIGEASARHIRLSDAEVHSRFIELRRASFPTAAAFESYLHRSAWTVSDLLLRIKLEMLSERLQRQVLGGSAHATRAQLESYYRANHSRFPHQSLAQARPAIEQQLTAAAQQRRFAAFKAAYQRRWKARTDCRAGFVLPQCRR